MARYDHLLRRMRGRDARAKAQVPPERPVREEPPDPRGLDCERCGAETRADSLVCFFQGYWLCPRCARFYRSLLAEHGLLERYGPKTFERG
jgi:hypothetical protein